MIYNATLKQYREVASVTDATHCTLSTAFTANITAAAFKYNSTMMNIYRDGSLFFTRGINTEKPFRIPSGRGREWEIEFKSDDKIYPKVKMAQSMEELL